jgi:hypothetical protein
VAIDAVPNNEPVNPKDALTPPITISFPVNENDPVILSEPVNLCVSSIVLPNADEPLEKLVVKYVIEFDTIYC